MSRHTCSFVPANLLRKRDRTTGTPTRASACKPVALADVRFDALYALESDVTQRPKVPYRRFQILLPKRWQWIGLFAQCGITIDVRYGTSNRDTGYFARKCGRPMKSALDGMRLPVDFSKPN